MVSVSSSELGDALVVSVIDAMAAPPLLVKSTIRCMVSPGTKLLAPSVRRLVAPADGVTNVSEPDVTAACATLVVEVNNAYVPRPVKVSTPASMAMPSKTLRFDESCVTIFLVMIYASLFAIEGIIHGVEKNNPYNLKQAFSETNRSKCRYLGNEKARSTQILRASNNLCPH